MRLELDEAEKKLLGRLTGGLESIRVYLDGAYPCAVSFVRATGDVVTLAARSEDIAPRFEVFPIYVSTRQLDRDADMELPPKIITSLEILSKSEWDEPASDEDKEHLFGDPTGATVQCEGKASDVPANAIKSVRLDAGIRCRFSDGTDLAVATSILPFSLYVSDCSFSEPMEMGIYDVVALVN